MKAIILAAGRGSRMGILTAEKPKCLTILNGKPLIEHQISALTQAGLKEIGIVTGYMAECLTQYDLKKIYNPLWQNTNMVHSLLCAQEWLETDDCIVSYSDIFYGSKIINELIKCKENISIAYDPNWLELWSKRFENPLDDAEAFRIDNNGCLLEIGQKPKSIEEIQGQYMGLLKFKKEFWEKVDFFIPPQMDMTSFLSKIIKKNIKVQTVSNYRKWGEIDNKEDLKIYSNI